MAHLQYSSLQMMFSFQFGTQDEEITRQRKLRKIFFECMACHVLAGGEICVFLIMKLTVFYKIAFKGRCVDRNKIRF